MSNYVNKYFILAACCLCALAAAGFKYTQTANDAEANTLIVGTQSGYPPFELVDADGKIVGFDMDLAVIIAEKLGKNLIIQDMEFEAEILSLTQGRIDLIMSGMNITPGRLKEIMMVPYYGNAITSLSLIFWNEVPEGIHSLEDLAKVPNATVSVHLASTSEEYLKKFPSIHAISFQDTLTPLMDVKFGKSMADLVEPEVADFLKAKFPEVKVIDVPLSEEDAIFGYGIAIKKGNHQLFEQITHIIHELRASGEMKALADKWFKGDGDV